VLLALTDEHVKQLGIPPSLRAKLLKATAELTRIPRSLGRQRACFGSRAGPIAVKESATMRLIRALVVVLAAALSTLAATDPAVAQFTIGGDPRVNPNDFRITTFASGLNYPNGLARLSDGSILVATSNPNGTGRFFASSGALLRFTDTDGDGIADGPGQVMYSDLVGVWVALKVAGPLVFITSAQQHSERITILRMNNGPALPYTFVGTLDFTFPANWEHKSYALAARPAQGGPANTYELYFNVGSTANFGETADPIGLSGLLQGTMQGASIYRVTVTDTGNGATVSNLTQIAKGLRNAAGMDFHPETGDLYFEDNGIDGLQIRDEPLSADELNRVATADLGRIVPDFGFPNDYIDSHTGQRVGSGGVQPLVTFRPLPCASCPDPGDPNGPDGAESEGPSGIVFAPPAFPSYVNNGVFVGFHGKFGAAPSGNEENPLVFWDLATGRYFHFIEAFQLGHGDQLLSTEDSLFIADMAADGSLNTNGGTGVVYQIRRRPTISVFITHPRTDGAIVSGTVWFTIWLENAAAGTRDLTLSIDGVALATMTSALNGPISMPWNTAGGSIGMHTATVSVRDGAGNSGSANLTVVVPGISVFITTPVIDEVATSGTVWFTIWLENAAVGTRDLTLSIDGVAVATTASTSNGPISMPWNTAGVSGGTHTATVSVRDAAGNSGSANRAVVVPSIRVLITHPGSDGATILGTTWFTIWIENAAAGSETYTMRVDGTVVDTTNTTSNGPVSMPWTTNAAANGSHSVTISVHDAAGGIGQAVRVVNVAN
jgi:glucose/arabinose dehydrogenase